MSIEYVSGDLLQSPADILVIPVNSVGVAGRGLAKQCKEHYPEWFPLYREACQSRVLFPGCPVLHQVSGRAISRCVLSFPTKGSWREASRLVDIERGLCTLLQRVDYWQISGWLMAFPKLGCGAGGLDWQEVQPLMEYYLGQFVGCVLIYL